MTTAIQLNPQKLLFKLAEANSTGCLELSTKSVSWKIYLQQGYLQYIDCSAESLDQLKYHLHYLKLKAAITALENLPQSLIDNPKQSSDQSIYGKVIYWLLSNKHLKLSEGVQLITSIVKDKLHCCIWIERGTSLWNQEHLLPSWITPEIEKSLSLNLLECLNETQIILRQWQDCSKQLLSVHQRPYFPPGWESQALPSSGSLNHKTLRDLTQVLRGRTSIRQLSILLNKEELQVAKILSPYIDEKIIYLHHPGTPLNLLPTIPRTISDVLESSIADTNSNITQASNTVSKVSKKIFKIVCIDDSPTILGEIKRFLSEGNFEITAIDDPVKAVSKIFNINPDLILLDITMPRINGYKLCGLLRSSGKCDNVPIIMVTGNTGLIDKARAKISGASDYFTKPFTKEGLKRIVAKHLS